MNPKLNADAALPSSDSPQYRSNAPSAGLVMLAVALHGRGSQVTSFGRLVRLAMRLPCARYLNRKPMVLAWATPPKPVQTFPVPLGRHGRHDPAHALTFNG